MVTLPIQLVHFLPGRVRVKLPRLKGNASLAGEVERTLTALQGIRHVETSTTTGSVLVLYEPLVAGVPWRDAGAFAWRAVAATAAASIWWVVPELVQSRYGLNFLRFTEQVGAADVPDSALSAELILVPPRRRARPSPLASTITSGAAPPRDPQTDGLG